MSYALMYPQRPWLLNAERGMHFRTHGALTAEWRGAFKLLARAQHIPHIEAVAITVDHHRKNARSIPDVAACLPAAKAAIDGITDAGVLTHDGPTVVRSLTFHSPQVDGFDGLTLTLYPIGT